MEMPKKPIAQDEDGDEAFSFDRTVLPRLSTSTLSAGEQVRLLRGLRGPCWEDQSRDKLEQLGLYNIAQPGTHNATPA
jgi:hypothetical protein